MSLARANDEGYPANSRSQNATVRLVPPLAGDGGQIGAAEHLGHAAPRVWPRDLIVIRSEVVSRTEVLNAPAPARISPLPRLTFNTASAAAQLGVRS
jgi:hypothetical protein